MQERFETFTVLINRISRDIRKIKNQEMAAYHLRSAHVSCLYYVYSLGSVTSAELCELYNSIWGNTGCESGICPL